ncbi:MULTISPECIES: Hsp20/alpha crystallin family protein [Sphingomonadaceae]|jgi:HSP20 family protein|uniref:Heat shock protein Hsp20 n=7 Tax=Sphingomonadaceae TaxID=41297 RepID=F6ESX1_SPHCR|nr:MULTISPECIES: Hsp20/alpha crystallin family protein [Sphingomonadaceae]ARR56413.1 heat-shock protein Hsp20 [Rhizorhabdus wittichii DC-6]AEG48587.1 heat shock protein Hsp20 [Sphingobium chlorophenolicum L-1]ALR21429.1 heat-shock protein Hsp20 [Sphingobium baderi]AMG72974.1 HspC2 heat shock protein [Sphingopyxis granuli]AMK18133.1 heat shock protein Hsp20 [Sphingobium sp. MI1205]
MNDQVPATTSKANPISPILDHPVDWLRTEIDRLFEDFGRPAASLFGVGNRSSIAPVPAVELVDEDKAYRLTAELPGLSDDDIDISVADGLLTIAGEKKEETERKDKGYVFSERRYGSFRRQVSLPSDVDPNAITAAFKDGVLTVTLTKDENAPARSRKIEIGQA